MTANTILLAVDWDVEDKITPFQTLLPHHPVADWHAANSAIDKSTVKYAVVWKPEHGLLKSCDNLEVIFSVGAGVDHIFSDTDLPDVPIVRFVDPDLTSRMVEYVVWQCLAHLRQQRAYDQLQQKGEWKELVQPAAHEIRVGIMGFGALGQASAYALLPLGIQINAWSRSPKEMTGVAAFHGNDQLETFLGQTDILVCLLPYTKETHGILNRSLFQKLARNGPFGAPVVINAGRGKSQNEADIIDCLQDGTLHGVSLDVFETEPLPAESALWKFENAILTPHIAAISDPAALARHVAKQINRYETGQPLEHIVDPEQGY